MNSKYIFIFALAVILLLGGYFLFSNKTNNQQVSGPSTTQNQTISPTLAQGQNSQEANITVTSSGFVPQTLTIKTGTKVVWTNKSGGAVTVNSDPHPIHTFWPFLNLGEFNDGSSVSVVFDKPGTYTYHNHLDPSQRGTIVVQ